jgi:hypothetical protein
MNLKGDKKTFCLAPMSFRHLRMLNSASKCLKSTCTVKSLNFQDHVQPWQRSMSECHFKLCVWASIMNVFFWGHIHEDLANLWPHRSVVRSPALLFFADSLTKDFAYTFTKLRELLESNMALDGLVGLWHLKFTSDNKKDWHNWLSRGKFIKINKNSSPKEEV